MTVIVIEILLLLLLLLANGEFAMTEMAVVVFAPQPAANCRRRCQSGRRSIPPRPARRAAPARAPETGA